MFNIRLGLGLDLVAGCVLNKGRAAGFVHFSDVMLSNMRLKSAPMSADVASEFAT